MCWATKITAAAQVEYRLLEACGCDLDHAPKAGEHLDEHVGESVDRQVEYRLQSNLAWIGSGLGDVGLVAGAVVDKDAARALMDGRHPWQVDKNGRHERLIQPKKVVAPAARVPAAQFVGAVHAVAQAAGVDASQVFTSKAAAARFARAMRGLRRDGDRHTVPIDDLEMMAAAARTDVAGVQVPALEDIYAGPVLAYAREHRTERVRVDQRGTDVVLDLPKSVSALYAVVDEVTAAVIEAEYMAAVGETVTALEGWASYGVTGHHGDGQTAARVGSSGFVGWTMLHSSARPVAGNAGDPHLHAHVVLAHMVCCEDGVWRAPGSGGRDIYRHVAASGELVKARVRARLSARLGVVWEHDESNGQWEIAGIPRQLREQFSSRSAQIAAAVGSSQASTAEQKTAAARLAEARPQVEPGDVRAQWRASAETVVPDVEAMIAAAMPGPDGPDGPVTGPGIGPEGPDLGPAQEAMSAEQTSPAVPSVQEIAAQVWTGQESLTAHTKAVTRVQILTAVAAACPGGVAGVQQLEDLTDAVIAAGPTIAVDQVHASHHSNTARWTTRDIVEAEHTITTAAARLNTGAAAVDQVVAEATVTAWAAERGLTLSREQAGAVTRLTTAGHGIDAVIGVAGAGKTTLMAAARTVWEDGGYSVAGASTAAVASAGLTAEAGIASRTIASWLQRLDQDPEGLRDVGVLVVDEGAMVDDRALARLITAAQASPANPDGTKIVLIGDHLQLRAIGVGGGFKAVHEIVAGAELADNRRQRDPAERAALATWREGARATALDQLAGAGRIHAVEVPEQAHTEMLTAWAQARVSNPAWVADPHAHLSGLVMLAARNTDVEDLNKGARVLMRQAGALDPAGADTVFRKSAAAGGGTIALAPGDLVRVRVNGYRSRTGTGEADVLNGYRAVVREVDERRRVLIEWRRPDPARPGDPAGLLEQAWMTPAQVADGHLSHGYAMTIAASQGMTCDLTFASGVGADAHSLYPALTRARTATHVWLARTSVEDPETTATLGPATDADRLARTMTAYAATIERDRPDTLISTQLTGTGDQAAAAVRDLLDHARQAQHQSRQRAERQVQPGEGVETVPRVDVDVAGLSRLQVLALSMIQDSQERAEKIQRFQERNATARTEAVPVRRQAPAVSAAGQELAARAELRTVQSWWERPYGSVATSRLAGLQGEAEQRAADAAGQAASLQAWLRDDPAPVRMALIREQLQATDTIRAEADRLYQQVIAMNEQISQQENAKVHDQIAAQDVQARIDRFLGDPFGRHTRTLAALNQAITDRDGQIRVLTVERDQILAHARTLTSQANQTRKDLGARHPGQRTPAILDELNDLYTSRDRRTVNQLDLHQRETTKQHAIAAGLTHEISLRAGLSPAANTIEDTHRTTAAREAARRAAEVEKATQASRATMDRDYRPPSHGHSGPSLGR